MPCTGSAHRGPEAVKSWKACVILSEKSWGRREVVDEVFVEEVGWGTGVSWRLVLLVELDK